jgi:hypothetical protein
MKNWLHGRLRIAACLDLSANWGEFLTGAGATTIVKPTTLMFLLGLHSLCRLSPSQPSSFSSVVDEHFQPCPPMTSVEWALQPEVSLPCSCSNGLGQPDDRDVNLHSLHGPQSSRSRSVYL